MCFTATPRSLGLNRTPGMTMGPWGIHYERTNTWLEQSRAWLTYLARCQSLLQKGQFVADVACLGTENAPNSFPDRESMDPAIPPGYDFDDLPPEVLLKQATVRDGRLVLKSGMSYRILVLPPGRTMTPALLAKIKELVVGGGHGGGAATGQFAQPGRLPALRRRGAATGGGSVGRMRWREHYRKPLWQGQSDLGKATGGRAQGIGVPLPTLPAMMWPWERKFATSTAAWTGDEVYFVASGVPEARRFLCTFRCKGSGRNCGGRTRAGPKRLRFTTNETAAR